MGAAERIVLRDASGLGDLPDFAPSRECAWAAMAAAAGRTIPMAHESTK